ncbi:MAG: porin [Hydrogenophaga sp.]|uniref:porin n=1 Tax=Hydrogenophaga sp. TaxID=1904254 RepID=UPI001A45D83C|nr:porin [Hydrogenophaga sp.]
MKKTLIALAAVAATGAAFAQSSVTIYGVADVSAGKVSDAVVKTPAVAATATAAAKPATYALGMSSDKFQAIANNTLNNGNSRLGFKGVEDLGGGLKAGFNFEQGINAANGATDANTYQRAAWVNVAGGFGEVRLGRSLSTSFYSVAKWELTGTANYSAVANQFSFNGAGPRNDAAIMYFSPDFSGFSFGASTVLKGNSANGNAKYDLSASYAAGPVVASLAYNTQKGATKSLTLGGKYTIGNFAVAASYTDAKMEATGVKVAKGFTLGGSTTMGPVTLTLDVARDTEFKDTDFVFETKYALSKRTFVYGVAMRDGKGKVLKQNATGYALGIRHNF